MISEHDLVALTVDYPEQGLRTNDLGAVISVHPDGAAYTVEFVNIGGDTIAVVTLTSEEVRPVLPQEMKQSRPLAAVG
jgi:hypothetical protein